MTPSKTLEIADQLDQAQAAFDTHQFSEALVRLRRVLEIDPSLPAARILEARIRLRQNLPRQAMPALDTHDLYHPVGRNHARGHPAADPQPDEHRLRRDGDDAGRGDGPRVPR
jgi:hypothetical protein